MEKRLFNEIKHGKFLASSGAGEIWNWESPAGKVRWARRVKLLSAEITPQMQVLEIGCGTGYFTRELAKTGAKIIAIDISPDLIAKAREEIKQSNVFFSVQNAYASVFQNDEFDYIAGSSVLHHLNLPKALSEINRILKPGGKFFFTEPNMLNPQIALQKNIPWLKKKLGDSPDETAFFRWQLYGILKKYGFSAISVQPFDFLHPSVPSNFIPFIDNLGKLIEKIPLLREIAGSLVISACKR